MKNTTKKSLRVSRETVAVLTRHQLSDVGGGAIPETKHSCLVDCFLYTDKC